MHHRHTRTATGLAAALLLALAVANASAGRLSASSSSFRVVWSALRFTNNTGQPTINCPVTVEGTLHSQTYNKVARRLIGYLTRVSLGTCAEGRATILSETLPWHVTYESFTGTLPGITGFTVLLVGATFEIESGGNICKARSEVLENAAGIAVLNGSGALVNFRADESRRIRLANGRGGAFCGIGSGGFVGSGSATVLGSSSQITVTLI